MEEKDLMNELPEAEEPETAPVAEEASPADLLPGNGLQG